MTVHSVAVATMKFLFDICDCIVDSDVGMSDSSLVLGICMCMDTGMCNCTSLQVWIGGKRKLGLKSTIAFIRCSKERSCG